MGMSMTLTVGVLALAVLATIAVVVAMVVRRGRNDWGGPPRPDDRPAAGTSDRAPYGDGAPDYPTAPPPVTPRSSAELDAPEGPAPDRSAADDSAPDGPAADGHTSEEAAPPPRRIDDSEQFRRQNRLDGDAGS